ncbi:hypothetical protein [Streptomyces vinaceus]|uniref:hypothetical protein n=1 Tax=Streptomyces vinaceus TaxID=1960 RepID=UPI0038106882
MGLVAVEGDAAGPGDELAFVGVGELEGQEDGLGGNTADAAGAAGLQVFVASLRGWGMEGQYQLPSMSSAPANWACTPSWSLA